ncbi:hypothetical protein [Anoxybacteroides tepidamans]|uniref:hypothetical protein n=1 Tax=Anoxybacteroides tepidamans TaxID=265948 RepID=UPI000486F3BB|nr:hypothetical protein [Anoxybacillus tepidamans]
MTKLNVILGIIVLLTLIVLFERPQWKRAQKKEKAAFVILLGMGTALAILLLYKPDLPGPTQMVDYIYRPLGRLLEE